MTVRLLPLLVDHRSQVLRLPKLVLTLAPLAPRWFGYVLRLRSYLAHHRHLFRSNFALPIRVSPHSVFGGGGVKPLRGDEDGFTYTIKRISSGSGSGFRNRVVMVRTPSNTARRGHRAKLVDVAEHVGQRHHRGDDVRVCRGCPGWR